MKLASEAKTEEDVPHSIRVRPTMNEFQWSYWNAYQELSGSRQYTSAGVAEILYSEKLAWLDENDIIDPDERRDYIQAISAIDGEYLRLYYEKAKVK